MDDLVRIRTSNSTGEPVVSARDLYKFLGVRKDFSNWIKTRIDKYGFVEDLDFALIFYDFHGNIIQLAQKGETDSKIVKKVHSINYILTMDCAKELAMVQNNEKGREARRYFIAVEKEYRKMREEKLILTQTGEIYEMSDVAKILGLSDYFGRVGRNRLYDILRHRKIVDEKNMALPKYVKRGFFENKPTHGMRATERGITFLNQMLTVENTQVKKLRRELKEMKGELDSTQQGVSILMEMLLVNKMGREIGVDKNREVMKEMQKYIEKTKPKQGVLGK